MENYPETVMEINGIQIQNLEYFILLGSKIYQDSTKSTNLAITQRIALAMIKFSRTLRNSRTDTFQLMEVPVSKLSSEICPVLCSTSYTTTTNAAKTVRVGIYSSPTSNAKKKDSK